MKKRLVNKKALHDTYVQLWRKSMNEHMRNIVRLNTYASWRSYPNNFNFDTLSDLERASHNISVDLWYFDLQQLKKYCKEKYHFNSKDFHKLKL